MNVAVAVEKPPAIAGEAVLRLNSLTKSYPGVVALSGFSMEVRPGEVIGNLSTDARAGG